MESKIEKQQRLANILAQARYNCEVSQEQMATKMGVSKKTIQNWEGAVSMPDIFQTIEWFEKLGLNPQKYYYDYAHPEMSSDDLHTMIDSISESGKMALFYLLYGEHNSSPDCVLNMLIAHLQSPLKDRVANATLIFQNYRMEKDLDNLTHPDAIQPNLDKLENAIESGRRAVMRGENGYIIRSVF